mmetsp:Transcript_21033/g.67173  ORF Transcript_21033/g.67173 Transcript_21033/m.67173 type:complete len:231 (+) Transcript_21033:1170-1862(+)
MCGEPIEEMLMVLTGCIGSLMRIKTTAGQPAALIGYYKLLLSSYFGVTSVLWARRMGWLLPPLIGLIALMMLGIADITSRLQRPFSDDTTALDMQRFCNLIKVNVTTVQKRYSPLEAGALGLHLPASKRRVQLEAEFSKIANEASHKKELERKEETLGRRLRVVIENARKSDQFRTALTSTKVGKRAGLSGRIWQSGRLGIAEWSSRMEELKASVTRETGDDVGGADYSV